MDDINTNPQAPKSGNGGKIIGLVIILALIVGIGWYFKSNPTKQTTKNNSESKMESKKDLSISELMLSGVSQKCEVSFKNDSSESTGVMYFADNKMKGDFTVKTESKTLASHILNDGFNLYSWTDGVNTGAKFPATATKNTTDNSQQSPEAIDLSAKYNYECSSWEKDSSTFIPPLSVNFIDPSNMMKDVKIPKAPANSNPAVTTGDKAKQCEVCNTSPESLRGQCRAALQCE